MRVKRGGDVKKMARGYFLYSKYSRFSKKSLTLVNSKLVLVQAPHGVTLLVTGLEIREGVTKEENMLSVIQNTQPRILGEADTILLTLLHNVCSK